MRRRGVRVFAVIAVIVALSIATLSVKNFDISLGGASIDADGSGPLGLKLGLDLQGGSHLVYEADLPDEVKVTFPNTVEEQELRGLLNELGHVRATIAKRDFVISDLALEDRAREALKDALEIIGTVESFQTGDGVLEVTFGDSPPTIEELRSLLDGIGYADATIVSPDENMFTIEGLALAEEAEEELRDTLEGRLAPIDDFRVLDGIVNVTFSDALEDADIRFLLNATGYGDAAIQSPAQKEYTIRELSLDEITQEEELRTSLELRLSPTDPVAFLASVREPSADDMRGVQRIIRRRVNALGTSEPIIQRLGDDRLVVQLPGIGRSTIDVTFRSISEMLLSIVGTLQGMGYPVAIDRVTQLGEDVFLIPLEETVSQEDQDALAELAQFLAPGTDILVSGDEAKEVAVTFPRLPDELTLRELLGTLGHTDLSIQQRSGRPGEFTIRTDETFTTEDQNRLREALEEKVGEGLSIDVTGGLEAAKRLIGGTAELVFTERECLVTLDELDAAIAANLRDLCDPVDQGGGGQFADKVIDLTGRDLSKAFATRDPATNLPELSITFNNRGRKTFSDLTRRLAGDRLKRMAIFLDDEELFAATVQAHITDGRTRITGRFTREQTVTWATQLESGRLPVPLTLIREQSVDALLGADSLRKSLIAGLVGLGLVLVFMVTYYRMAGIVAGTALLVYAVILLAIFKLVPVTLTLSGIAGLVLSIGMAVDANVLIFERIKEEMRTGRTLASSMEVGFRRAWVAIRDSNISTIITCAILFMFGSRLGGGTPVVTGFALTLLIGVSVSMFTAIMVSRNMLQILALTPLRTRMTLFTPEPPRQPVAVAGGGK